MPHQNNVKRDRHGPMRLKPGSGKNGNLLKRDYCKRVVDTVVTGATPEEKEKMVAAVCGLEKKTVDVEVLAAMSQLDPENQEGFQKLRRMALDTLEASIYGSAEKAASKQSGATFEEAKKMPDEKVPKLKEAHAQAVSEANKRNFDLTPTDLKLLLPGKGEIRGYFWARYNPLEDWFRVTYPTGVSATMGDSTASKTESTCTHTALTIINPPEIETE